MTGSHTVYDLLLEHDLSLLLANTFVSRPFHAFFKSLWILREKFKCQHTSLLDTSHFATADSAFSNISKITFPLLLSVTGNSNTFNHVVVIWRYMIIDFESSMTIPLSVKTLNNLCGEENEFLRVDHGCGIFPSRSIKRKCGQFGDWGENLVGIKHLFPNKQYKK